MNGKEFLKIVTTVVFILLFSFFVIPINRMEAKTIELNYATMWPDAHLMTKADVKWARKIEKDTNGRVKITVFSGGALINPRKDWSELVNGVADIAQVTPSYGPEGFEVHKLVRAIMHGCPDLETNKRIMLDVWDKYPEIRAEWDEATIIAWTTVPSYWLNTKKPVRTLADIKGMTIKVPSRVHGIVVNALGGNGVTVPMPEAYVQLEKGILDGAFAPMEAVAGFNLAEVVKNHTELHMWIGWQPNKVVNMDSWNRLPKDIQKIFLDSRPYWEDELVKGLFGMDDAGRKKVKEMGNEFIQLSPDDLKELYRVMDKEYAKEAKKLDEMGIPGTAIFNDIRQAVEQAQ